MSRGANPHANVATHGGGRNMRKPPALKPGDTVAVVALSAAIEPAALERGIEALHTLGYRTRLSGHVTDREGIFAGCDQVRAHEFTNCYKDPKVQAVFAARGGYGCGRLLPMIDFAAIARTPKIFLGFSDATFLLNALVNHADCVSFHGPMVAMDFAKGLSQRSLEHLASLLSGSIVGFELPAREVIRPGLAEGPLIGGCLSVITAMLGTAWQPVFDGRILFLEDTGEKAYRIDRMLVQMRQAGVLGRVAGMVFGALRPLDESERERGLIRRFVEEQTAGLECPVFFGVEAGHGTENLTLPLGAKVRLDSRRAALVCTEVAVSLG
jgi:muramoyltetrapeptide carboxypeptidase